MAGWEELDTTGWTVITTDSRGKREKEWVRGPDGGLWLRKQPRMRTGQSSPYEPAIEWLMLCLAASAGIATAECHPSFWTSRDDGRRGIVVRCFLEAREELSSGEQVLRGKDPHYPSGNWSQTVALVRAALEANERFHSAAKLLLPFAHIIAFDAWIGNADRHQGNWGVLKVDSGVRRLAPMYDPAACLGVELDDKHTLLTKSAPAALKAYIDRCPSGFGDGNRGVAMARVVAEIRSWETWSNNVRSWIASFCKAMDTLQVDVDGIPETWLPIPRKRFVLSMLRMRLQWLSEQA